MNTRLPPEYAGELFFKAEMENMSYPMLPPEGAVDLLTKACSMLGQVRFDWAYIDRPKEGSAYVVMLNGDDVPHDGYQYMDDEVVYNFTSETGKRLVIQERQQGFIPGDQFTHIVRRRYKLVNIGKDNIVLLHYTRADDSRKAVADPRMAKTPPRNYPLKPLPSATGAPGQPMAYPQQQPGMPGYRPPYPTQSQPQPAAPQQMKSPATKGGSPYGASPVVPGSPGTAIAGPQAGYGRFQAGVPPQQIPGQPIQPPQPNGAVPQRLASIKKQSHKKQPNPQATLQAQLQHQQMLAQQQEDAEEPSGDELDFLTTRDVAIARYKRNHDYMAEVFSPYAATAIIPNQYDYQQSIEFFKSLQEKHSDDLDDVKQNHDEKIKRFKTEADVFYRGMLELKQATTVQEVVAANERVESYIGAKVLPYSFLRRTELPPDEASKTPELKAKPAPDIPIPPVPTAAPTADGSAAEYRSAATEVSMTPLPPAATAGADAMPAASTLLAAEVIAPTAPTTETPSSTNAIAAEVPASLSLATPAAEARVEAIAMDIDGKLRESASDLNTWGDMQVDNVPPAAETTLSVGEPAVPVDVVAATTTAVPLPGEPSSTITDGEDHVMSDVPAPEPESIVAPADALPAAGIDAVAAPTSAASEPASAPASESAPIPISTTIATEVLDSDAPTPVPSTTPTPVAALSGQTTPMSTLSAPEQSVPVESAVGGASPTPLLSALAHPAEIEAPIVSHSQPSLPPPPTAGETIPSTSNISIGVEETPVPDEMVVPQVTATSVDHAPVNTAAVPPADVLPQSAPMRSSPTPAESTMRASTPTSSTANLAAAGSGDSAVDASPRIGAAAATTMDPIASSPVPNDVQSPPPPPPVGRVLADHQQQSPAGDPAQST